MKRLLLFLLVIIIGGFLIIFSLFQVTTATRLMSHRVDEQLVMGRTGHRSVQAVREYKRPDSFLQKEISDILQPPPPKKSFPETLPCVSDALAVVPAATPVYSGPGVERGCSFGNISAGTCDKGAVDSKVFSDTGVPPPTPSSASADERKIVVKLKRGDSEIEICM